MEPESESESATARLKARCLSAAEEIRSECAAILGCTSPSHSAPPLSSSSAAADENLLLSGCGAPLVELLHRQASGLVPLYQMSLLEPARAAEEERERERERERGKDIRLLRKRLDDIISVSYSKFYAYVYADLPPCWRQLYTDASILKFCLLVVVVVAASPFHFQGDSAALDEMIRTLDLALVLAGAAGAKRGRRWIDETLLLLEEAWREGISVRSGDDSILSERPCKKRRLSGGGERKEGEEEEEEEEEEEKDWSSKPSFSTDEAFTPPVKHPARRVRAMPMEDFQAYLDRAGEEQRIRSGSGGGGGPTPMVISGLVDDWPARTNQHPWDKPAYLLSRTFGGRRLVPVETGRSYVDDGWGQKLVTFGTFLQTYIDPSSSPSALETKAKTNKPPMAYLAQHQLFAQLPQLRADVLIPDLCYTAPPPHPSDPAQDRPELEAPQLNAWFGPPGTITPLHTDPYHNLLVQVVGRKYVRLYGPEASARMRARGKEGGVDMGNTSELDVGVLEGWDVDAHAADVADEGGGGGGGGGEEEEEEEAAAWKDEFRKTPFVDCILEPGDTLYIPIGWWHYVRGLSVSFSVSFWWN